MALNNEQAVGVDTAITVLHSAIRMLVEDSVSQLSICAALYTELEISIKSLPEDSQRASMYKLLSDNLLKNI